MNWNKLKPIIEQEIANANITDKDFIKIMLKFSRRVNTIRNMMTRYRWEYICENGYTDDAHLTLDEIKNNYGKLYEKYAEANGYTGSSDLGDYLA